MKLSSSIARFTTVITEGTFMYKDRKRHNYLMLELRRLKESGATTIDTSNGTLLEAVQEARQVLDNDYSHLTGIERWYATKDVALARWALSVTTQNSTRQATQRAGVDNAIGPTPPIHENSAEPVFPEPDDTDLEAIIGSMSQEEWASILHPEELSNAEPSVGSSFDDSGTRVKLDTPLTGPIVPVTGEDQTQGMVEVVAPALLKLDEFGLSPDDLRMVASDKGTIDYLDLCRHVRQYRGQSAAEFGKHWCALVSTMERQGLATRTWGDLGIRLTEQGKAWLNEASGSAGSEAGVDAQTLNPH
jgi:hypothetical protein